MKYFFHKQITEENKKRLKEILNKIHQILENEGFEFKRFPSGKSRSLGSDGKPINCLEVNCEKEGVKYLITTEIIN